MNNKIRIAIAVASAANLSKQTSADEYVISTYDTYNPYDLFKSFSDKSTFNFNKVTKASNYHLRKNFAKMHNEQARIRR